MASERESIVPPTWRGFFEATKIPAAVRADGVLYVSGHTGDLDGHYPDDIEAQFRAVFRGLELTLAEAGADWSDVVELTSYHVGMRDHFPDLAFKVAAEFLAEPYPTWTALGVTELYDAEAVIEISCTAVLSRRA